MRSVRRPWERVRVAVHNDEPSMTEQSHRESVDINNVVQRHVRSGGLPPPRGEAQYVDVTALQADLSERIAWSAQVLEDARRFLDSRVSEPAAPVEEAAAVTA